MSTTRAALAEAIADKSDLTRAQAESALVALQEVVSDAVSKGEAVKLPGFISIERTNRAARTGRNPRTGEAIDIPAGYGVKISAGAALKKAATS